MAKLSPSILSADFSNLQNEIELIEKGGADYIHCDVMDGAFVPNISFGAPVIKSLVGKTKLKFDVHLMIKNPQKRIADFATNQTEFIVVHQEACKDLDAIIEQIHDLGIKAGVAIKPKTPISEIKSVLKKVDLVLVMSVNPGFSGQKFMPETLVKVCELDEIRKARKLPFLIEMDGGINMDNALALKNAGVDIMVAGNACFKAPDVIKACKNFKKLIK